MAHQWICLIKDGKKTSELKQCPSFKVSRHPLHIPVDIVTATNKKALVVPELDPLTSAIEGGDPLSAFVQESLLMDNMKNAEDIEEKPTDENGSKAWSKRKISILNKYTTLEKLSIVSSYLPGGEKMTVKPPSVSEQMKHRLEQLDEFDDGSVRKTINLTQQEYASRIALLNQQLVQAWDTEQRVKALKIAIQCSKLLADTSVMRFYPSKFVLITDILDTFGNLVYDRLKGKSYEKAQIPKYLSEVNPDVVPESAKETCQNWLYKMASIRELIPRLYIEMSLLRCYIFLSRNEFDSAIARLTQMIRGVGNPLVAVYARCYLSRVAMNVITKNRDYFKSNLQEFLQTYPQIFEPALRKSYESELLNIDMYLNLYTPALDWLFYGMTTYDVSTEVLLAQLLAQCEQLNNKELLLYSTITSFDSCTIKLKAEKILELINSCESVVMKQEMIRQMGEHMCIVPVTATASAALVQAAWEAAGALSSLEHTMRALEPWLQFASMHLSMKHVNVLLRGVLKRISRTKESASSSITFLHATIKRMMNSVEDVEELFLMDSFMPLFDVVQSGPAQLDMTKMMLNIYFQRRTSPVISDHILIGNLMRLCRILHNAINALTVEDEQKQISELVSRFVQSVSLHHDDHDELMQFYLDCRKSFINLDAVLVTLVHCVNRLAVCATEGATGGGPAQLVRACAAYCYITVPSLPCPLLKAQLYLLTGQVALLNSCLGQAEACLKASVSLIPEVPATHLEDGQMKSTHLKVHALLTNFLSTLLVVPDNVESNSKLYLLKGLLRAMDMLTWERTDAFYYSLQLHTLDLLCSFAQENYAYHLESVISNDLLYGSDPEYIAEINQLSTLVLEKLLATLKVLGDEKCFKKQHNLTLELMWRVVRRGDLASPQMESLAANLWLLAQRNGQGDVKLAKSIATSLIRENERSGLFKNLISRLQIK